MTSTTTYTDTELLRRVYSGTAPKDGERVYSVGIVADGMYADRLDVIAQSAQDARIIAREHAIRIGGATRVRITGCHREA